jgi:Zn-dependent protease/predicted transcriptional regulator
MFGNSWRLGRIAGVEVRIDTSWVVIALLVTYSMFALLRDLFPDFSRPGAVLLGAFFAILFFGSVLAHEMAHALVAKRRGIPVRGITLFLFGGATHAKVDAQGPRDELVVSVVGPVSSVLLGGVFLLLGMALRPVLRPLGFGFLYVGGVNLVLALFNMLPGFPLDGGRVLRSLVWRATGNLSRATRVASTAGQVVGFLLIAAGVFSLTQGQEELFRAIWLAAIGWFLVQAARSSYQEVEVRRFLEGVEAEDLMTPELVSIPGEVTLRDAVDEYFMRYNHGAFPVTEDGRTSGLLTLRTVKQIPRDGWDARRVRDAMDPIGDQLTVSPETRMDRVLTKLQEGDRGRVLVVRDGEVVGMITASDITRWLERRRALMA